MVERRFAVMLTAEEWKRVSNCLIIVAEERGRTVNEPEDQINKEIWGQLERQGVIDRG